MTALGACKIGFNEPSLTQNATNWMIFSQLTSSRLYEVV